METIVNSFKNKQTSKQLACWVRHYGQLEICLCVAIKNSDFPVPNKGYGRCGHKHKLLDGKFVESLDQLNGLQGQL